MQKTIECASRPKADAPLEGKPVAIMSASTGRFGGARAQYHLRQTFIFLNMYPVNRPSVMMSDAPPEHRREQTRQLIKRLLETLVKWTARLREKPQQKHFNVSALTQQSLKMDKGVTLGIGAKI